MTVSDVFAFAADEEQHRALVPDAFFLCSNANEVNTVNVLNDIRLAQEVVNYICDCCPWLGSPLAVSLLLRPFLLRTPACISCACTLCSVESSVRDQGSSLIVFEFMDLEDELSGEDAGAGPSDETRPRPLAQLFPVCVGGAQRSRRTEVRCSQ